MSEDTMRVLYVAGNPEVAESLVKRRSSLAVETARSAERARKQLKEETFDCAVSRLDLPDADGLSFLSSVADASQDVLAVLYTPQNDSDIVAETYEVGAEYVPDVETGSAEVLDRYLANLPSVESASASGQSDLPSEGKTPADRANDVATNNAWSDRKSVEPSRHLTALARQLRTPS